MLKYAVHPRIHTEPQRPTQPPNLLCHSKIQMVKEQKYSFGCSQRASV